MIKILKEDNRCVLIYESNPFVSGFKLILCSHLRQISLKAFYLDLVLELKIHGSETYLTLETDSLGTLTLISVWQRLMEVPRNSLWERWKHGCAHQCQAYFCIFAKKLNYFSERELRRRRIPEARKDFDNFWCKQYAWIAWKLPI